MSKRVSLRGPSRRYTSCTIRIMRSCKIPRSAYQTDSDEERAFEAMTPTIRSTCTWPYPRHQTKKVATVRYLRTKCIVTVPTTRLGLPTAPSVGSRCLFVDSRVVNTRTDETMYMPVGGRKVNMTNELLIQMHLYRLNGLIDRSLGTVR